MDLYLLDETRTPIQVIDDYVMLVWTERYRECGDFELDLKTTRWKLSDFSPGRYLTKSDSSDMMIIESREISNDSEEGSSLKIKGRSITSILDRRLNMSKFANIYGESSYSYSGDVSEVVKQILDEEFINPKLGRFIEWEEIPGSAWDSPDGSSRITYEHRNGVEIIDAPYRKMDEITIGDFQNFEIEVTRDCTQVEDCLSLIGDICKSAGVGFRLKFDEETKNFIFELYEGKDRTTDQYDREPLYFSEEMSNVMYVDYYEDISTWKNALYAGGSEGKVDYGEKGYYKWETADQARGDPSNIIFPGYKEVYITSAQPTGFYRREAFNEDSSISIPEYSEDGTKYSTPEDWYNIQCPTYVEAVGASGKNFLGNGDIKKVVDATGEIDTNVLYSYGIDYFMGDIVEIDTGYGVNAYCVIDEVVYSYGQNGITVTPNFSKLEEDE